MFAWWQLADIIGVPWEIKEHKLNDNVGIKPIRQQKIGQSKDRNKAINDEVDKLVSVGIVRELFSHLGWPIWC